ncbi:CU044_2847 family protein [Streptomyces sp. TG1A-8]|uniref:CU044_2847 family protein n=1 Tax=Streptomyces sp. TG1A-8 TaxID=3051385 RepID=UPI00265BD5BD|nr:CU044_2847 family protein [Streptomyces sp. TG1A-8]MDO0927823.1 CU044_2847 family protein [Streptomyces sp. TG1A-8]
MTHPSDEDSQCEIIELQLISHMGADMYKAVKIDGSESEFLVEVTPLAEQSKILRGRGTPEQALTGLRQVGDAIVQTCEDVSAAIRERFANTAPNELEVKFGVSLSGEGGVPLVGKVKADSTFEVRARWTR